MAAKLVALLAPLLGSISAEAAGIRIKERVKYYTISGRSAPEFAKNMSRKGPYSFQHGRRAWATAAREMSYDINPRKRGKLCSLQGIGVQMTITYTMPKLRSTRGVSAREAKNWQRMYALLNKHERVHGKYYRQLANRVYRKLKRMKPDRNCATLRRAAIAAVQKLAKEDTARNARFDRTDRGNYRRMARIYSR